MADFAYAMPDEIPTGPQLWEFTNSGEQWHMMFVVSLAEGAGVEDVMAFLGDPAAMPAGPPPFEFAPDAGIPPSVWANVSGSSPTWRPASTWSAARFLM
jgi:hypothetical protein